MVQRRRRLGPSLALAALCLAALHLARREGRLGAALLLGAAPQAGAAAGAAAEAAAPRFYPPCPGQEGLRPTCLDPDGPVPYVLLTLGRSGSGSTWQIIGNLTGLETPSEEYTGSGPTESARFFARNSGPDNDRWMMRNLCGKQLRHPGAGVVGFKWKPFDTIFSDSAGAALRTVAALDRPRIAVVRSRRNLLDVVISKQKHAPGNVRSSAHCLKGDEDCLKRQIEAGTGLVLPTDDLLDKLRTWNRLEEGVDKLLEELGVPHVAVTYERLYYGGDDTSEWMRIFRFLGVGPGEGLTRERLEGAMEHVATHHPSRNATLANYAEVAEVLRGTEFEELLHR
jgi:hypothetical protein